jgi:hypothetical protein
MNRCMKARKSSRVSCGCWVTVGQLIVKRPGDGWRCWQCTLADIRAGTTTTERTP